MDEDTNKYEKEDQNTWYNICKRSNKWLKIGYYILVSSVLPDDPQKFSPRLIRKKFGLKVAE